MKNQVNHQEVLQKYAEQKFSSQHLEAALGAKNKDQLSILYGLKYDALIPLCSVPGASNDFAQYSKCLNRAISNIAHSYTNWGRKKNTNFGYYVPPRKKTNTQYYSTGMRVEDVRRGKYISHEYYSDYSFWYSYAEPNKVNFSFDSKIFTVNIFDYFLEDKPNWWVSMIVEECQREKSFGIFSAVPADVTFKVNIGFLTMNYKGQLYHFDNDELFTKKYYKDVNNLFASKRQSLKRRYVNDQRNEIMRKALKNAHTVDVSFEDSINAGNCISGTEAFIKKHGLSKNTSMKGHELLAIEDSTYTRRVVLEAYVK